MQFIKPKKSIALAIAASAAITGSYLLAQNKAEDAVKVSDANTQNNTKKVILLSGDDFNHKSGTHEFQAGTMLIKNSLEAAGYGDQLDIHLVHNWPEDTSVFEGADVVLHYYKGNNNHFMNTAKNSAFINTLAEKGCSQLFVHYAVDPGAQGEEPLKNWTGACYKDKLSTNPHWDLKGQLGKHPINSGLTTMNSYDEWYFKMDYKKELLTEYEEIGDPAKVYSVMYGLNEDVQKSPRLKKPFKKKELTASDLTVFWATENDNGSRGVGITGAHYHKNWANDDFRKQVLNAIVWAADLKVPENGVVSPAITEEVINQNLDARKKGGIQKITLN